MSSIRVLRHTNCLLAFLATTFLCQGQTNSGRISGTVLDPSGSSVAGATIVVVNDATQVTAQATSDEKGLYVVTNLQPGPYTVTTESQGFKRVSMPGYTLSADARLTVDVRLEIGQTSQNVEVLAAAGEAVNLVSGEISRSIDSKQVDKLALNGRNYMQLASIIPGSALLQTDQLALTTSLSTQGQSINGSRPNSSNITVDGSFNLDAGSNGSQLNAVALDFIDEVKIQTSNFSAEYGRQSGSSINVITKSGTNQFHGGAFEFLRNNELDARTFFAAYRPPLRFNDFGWSVGGPIQKNKLFFFGGQEYKRIRQFTAPALRTLPTRAQRQGDFSGNTGSLFLPGTTTPVARRNVSNLVTADGRAIANVYNTMESLASSYTDTPTGNNAVYQLTNPFNGREDLVRLDYHLNDRHTLYGRYMHDNYDVRDPFGSFVVSQLPTTPNNRLRPATSWQIAHTWAISPTLVNELKGNAGWQGQNVFLEGDNWTRDRYGFTFSDIYRGGGRYPDGIPGVSVLNYSGFLGPTFFVSTSTDISVSDNLTWIRGSHTIKAGGIFTRNRKDANGRPSLTGSASFNPLGNSRTTSNAFADALLGNFRTYSETQYDPVGMFRFSQLDAFVTDQWKVSRNFSIEAGVRFQSLFPTYTVANNITNFDPALYDPARAVSVRPNGQIVPNSGFLYNGLIRAGSGVPEDQLGRVPDGASATVLGVPSGARRGFQQAAFPLAPRFSFAWSPGSDTKTSIRGGFGMFYDRTDQIVIVQTLTNPPFAQSVQYENANIVAPTSGNVTARSAFGAIRAIDPNLKTPYIMNYSLSIQRELPSGLFLEAAYVGNQGRHLTRQPDINQPNLADLAANAALPASRQSSVNALRPYRGYSQILQLRSDASSNYNSLQLYLTKRKGPLTMTGSYTWSKALANASSGTEGSENPNDVAYYYGPTSFDRRHIFVGTFTAELPRLANSPSWRRAIAGGWDLSGILRAQSGAYYTISSTTAIGPRRADYVGGDLLADSGDPRQYLNATAFAIAPLSRYGNAGPGIIPGPGLQQFDFSLAKQFHASERVTFRFQADVFNSLNRANFTALSTDTTSLGFGSLTAAGPGRNLQLGIKARF